MSNLDFVHPSLPEGLAIRILTLEPGHESEILRCTTASYKLEDAPSYNALSYTWGSESRQVMIKVNNQLFYIRRNLSRFLRRLRKPKESLVLWCDMLCINQNAIPERNRQVRMMGDIYQRADQVLVWLGDHKNDKPEYLECFNFLQTLSFNNHLIWSKRWPEVIDAVYAMVSGKGRSHFHRPTIRMYLSGVILYLFSRKYWRRIWILQEVGHASQLSLYYGSYVFSWAGLWQIIDRYTQLGEEEYLSSYERILKRVKLGSQRADIEASNIASIDKSVAHRLRTVAKGDRQRKSLQSHFDTLRDGRCADPRDKIYGVASIIDDLESLEVDYDKSADEIFLNVLDIMRMSGYSCRDDVIRLAALLEVDLHTVHQVLRMYRSPQKRTYRYFLDRVGHVTAIAERSQCIGLTIRPIPPKGVRDERGGMWTSERDLERCYDFEKTLYSERIEVGDCVSRLCLLTTNPDPDPEVSSKRSLTLPKDYLTGEWKRERPVHAPLYTPYAFSRPDGSTANYALRCDPHGERSSLRSHDIRDLNEIFSGVELSEEKPLVALNSIQHLHMMTPYMSESNSVWS